MSQSVPVDITARDREIVRRYVARHFRRYAQVTPEVCDDAVQDAALQWCRLTNRTGRMHAFLCVVAVRKVVKYLRSGYMRHTQPLAEWDDGEHRDACVIESEARRTLFASLREHVEALPPVQRAVVLAHYYDGLPFDRVAQALGIGNGAARMAAVRARRTLAERIPHLVPGSTISLRPLSH